MFAQNKLGLADGGGYDCLYAYNVQYSTFNQQFESDISDCITGLVMDWLGQDAISSFMNSSCAMDALHRFYTNCDNAADAFAACSGLAIHN